MRRQRAICAEVLESGAFCALPPRAQALYVHFQLYADDDGVVANEKLPMISCGANSKDLATLVETRFLLRAGSVYIIKHWWLNNTLKRDRHKRTTWANEIKDVIFIRQDRVYSDHEGPDRMPFLDGLTYILDL